jgi:hypothetical protein
MMHGTAVESGSRWRIATAGAVAIVAAMLLLFRVPAPVSALSRSVGTPVPKATVQMARTDRADALLEAEAELRDLRPLFLPTERNAALSEPRLEPGRTFLKAEITKPVFSDAEAQISKALPPVALLAGKPVQEATAEDVLGPQEHRLTLQGFGRQPVAVPQFEQRGGYIEVSSMQDGRRVLEIAIPWEGRPPVDKAWAPLEFIAALDAAGLVSPLVVTEGSRVDEVDAHFRTYLMQTFRIGQRLPAGFYRITVAP